MLFSSLNLLIEISEKKINNVYFWIAILIFFDILDSQNAHFELTHGVHYNDPCIVKTTFICDLNNDLDK